MSDDRLVMELRRLGDDAFPATPDLVTAVTAAIMTPEQRRSRWPAVAAVAAAVVVVTLLTPAPRRAIADFLGIGGITIERVAEYELPPAAQTDAPLGDSVELAAVPDLVGFMPALPRIEGLTDPEVYVRMDVAGGLVSLVYAAEADAPGLIITQFESAGEVGIKQLDPGVAFTEVFVIDDLRGFWIEGGAHTIAFIGANGQAMEDSARLVGNTLIWQRNGVTYRIESALPLDEVRSIARSMGSSN